MLRGHLSMVSQIGRVLFTVFVLNEPKTSLIVKGHKDNEQRLIKVK